MSQRVTAESKKINDKHLDQMLLDQLKYDIKGENSCLAGDSIKPGIVSRFDFLKWTACGSRVYYLTKWQNTFQIVMFLILSILTHPRFNFFLKKQPQGCSSFIPDQSFFCHTAAYRNFDCVMPEGVSGQVIALMLKGGLNFKEKMGLSPHEPGCLTVCIKEIKCLFPCTPKSSGRTQTSRNQYSGFDWHIFNCCWSPQDHDLTGCWRPLLSKDTLSHLLSVALSCAGAQGEFGLNGFLVLEVLPGYSLPYSLLEVLLISWLGELFQCLELRLSHCLFLESKYPFHMASFLSS